MKNDYVHALRFNMNEAQEFFAKELAYQIGPVELRHHIKRDQQSVIIDVREKKSFEDSHIKGAISMPFETLAENLTKLSKNNIHFIYSYNQNCSLAQKACLFLVQNDYPAVMLTGGISGWMNNDFEIEE